MNEPIATDHAFNPAEKELLQTLAGLIIPADEEYGVPGADDPLIFEALLTLASSNAEQIKQGLDVAREVFQEHEGEDAIAQLEGHRALGALVSAVMQCYYIDERVMLSLDKPARPPFPQGYEVEQGDWGMLAEVQARGKIWRDA